MLGQILLQLVVFGGSTGIGLLLCLLRISGYIDRPDVQLSGLPSLSPLLVRALWTLVSKPRSTKPLQKLPDASVKAGPVPVRERTVSGLLALCPEASRPAPAELPLLVCPSIEAFRLCLALLVRKQFPLSVLGSVLIKYKVTQHRRLQQHESLSYSAAMLPDVRQTDKGGFEFDLQTTAKCAGELVWMDSVTFYCPPSASNRQARASGAAAGSERGSEGAWQGETVWHLGQATGWRFGQLNGDLNPIHLHPLAAILFGFRSNIAHGTLLVARSLASMQHAGAVQMRYPCSMEAEFKRPALLPCKAVCRWKPVSSPQHDGGSQGSVAFHVDVVPEKPFVVGSWSPVAVLPHTQPKL